MANEWLSDEERELRKAVKQYCAMIAGGFLGSMVGLGQSSLERDAGSGLMEGAWERLRNAVLAEEYRRQKLDKS